MVDCFVILLPALSSSLLYHRHRPSSKHRSFTWISATTLHRPTTLRPRSKFLLLRSDSAQRAYDESCYDVQRPRRQCDEQMAQPWLASLELCESLHFSCSISPHTSPCRSVTLSQQPSSPSSPALAGPPAGRHCGILSFIRQPGRLEQPYSAFSSLRSCSSSSLHC